MMEIDEKRFRERIDQTYPFTKGEQERHGMADIAKGAILNLLAEEMKPRKSVTEIIEEVKKEICDRYCKYADTYNYDSDEMPEECNNCPLNRL